MHNPSDTQLAIQTSPGARNPQPHIKSTHQKQHCKGPITGIARVLKELLGEEAEVWSVGCYGVGVSCGVASER